MVFSRCSAESLLSVIHSSPFFHDSELKKIDVDLAKKTISILVGNRYLGCEEHLVSFTGVEVLLWINKHPSYGKEEVNIFSAAQNKGDVPLEIQDWFSKENLLICFFEFISGNEIYIVSNECELV